MALTDAERQRRSRRRRARAIEATPAAPLRDTSELLWPALSETLSQLDLGREHAAAKKLAQRYAQVIDQHEDQGWAMRWIAPLLLDCLEQLGATPAARARLGNDAKPPAGPSRLDQLRMVRAHSDASRSRPL